MEIALAILVYLAIASYFYGFLYNRALEDAFGRHELVSTFWCVTISLLWPFTWTLGIIMAIFTKVQEAMK
jgi:TRAP-type C4-dicarboxylate transport system permease large subunit